MIDQKKLILEQSKVSKVVVSQTAVTYTKAQKDIVVAVRSKFNEMKHLRNWKL